MDPRLILAIETSNPSSLAPGVAGEIALGRAREDGGAPEPLGVETVRGGERLGDDLAAAIERLCSRSAAAPGDLARVVVSIGPGGFTSLRIAAATARMISEATGAACVGVPSADVVAEGVAPGVRSFAVALASKRGSAWVAAYGRPGGVEGEPALVGEPGVLGVETLGALHVRSPVEALVADAHLDPALAAWAAGAGVAVVAPVFSAPALLRLGAGRPPTDAAAFVPLYPREPEAVTKWRELGRSAR